MKDILLILITALAFNGYSQQTYVPDNNFEAYLENNSMGNGIPNDDYVTTANISGVTSLVVWGWSIADMTGIEDFASLSMLYCFDNPINTLDVSQNTQLNDLRCNNNSLTAIDVSNCPSLTTFFCYNNDILNLDLSQNPALSDLRCFNNSLTSLDVSSNPGLTRLFCYDNFFSALDVTSNPNLDDLRCYDNQIGTLDLSQNTSLSAVWCYENELTTLDVSQCALLGDLRCYDNLLTQIDLTNCAPLTLLIANDNLLTSLDVSLNYLLTDVYCQNNELTCLKANNGLNIAMDCTNNELDCISVLFPAWSDANALHDVGVNFNVVCTYVLDNDVDQDLTSLTAVQNGASYVWFDCDNVIVVDEVGQSFTPVVSGFYAVEITYVDPCGDVHIDTSSCHYQYVAPDDTGLEELINGDVELVKTVDLMGRETPFKANTVLIYMYSDGTTERVFKMN